MKYLFQFFLYCLLITSAKAQPLSANINSHAGKSNTYAVVIGISKYLDPDINALQYSNRDAQVFADFLMSASGGSVPKQNIKLLIDDAATTGEVDKAIIWLKDNCQPDDNVFFYFSGHGALENETLFKDGYLICYNTPAKAFVRMGLSIDWLNKMASTISDKKANVVIITDACHSGRVANNKFKGNILVGEQLLTATEKEIRMASCTPDQLSIEKADWGGGRGVFSYHLINGLQGSLADKDHNGIVTTGEIKNYVEYKMANDSVLKRDNEVQTPVVKGRANFPLSTFVAADAAPIKQMVAADSVVNVMMAAPVVMADETAGMEPGYYFNEILKNENLVLLTDKLALNYMAVEKIPFAIIDRLISTNTSPAGIAKLNELTLKLKNNPGELGQFNIELSRAFNDKGQEKILQYLKGDEEEMERRRYYYIYNNEFDTYTMMLEIAVKLSQGDRYLNTSSTVLFHYFNGVSLRLQIQQAVAPAALIEKAFTELNKALALEEHAAYIYNELGILYGYKDDFAAAEKSYLKATQLSPGWALPYANLCGLYAAKGDVDKSAAACNQAESLQPGIFAVKIHRGYLNEIKGNSLLAEESFYSAIETNSRHFAAFERLGFVNLTSSNYAKADSFFYEAAQRKIGYNFAGNKWDVSNVAASPPMPPPPQMPCDAETVKPDTADILANFSRAVAEYRNYEGNIKTATALLKAVIQHDSANPLAYHYLGKIYFDQQRWEEADQAFKLAIQYYRDEAAVLSYVDSLMKNATYPYDRNCYKDYFISAQYGREQDYYLAGCLAESWKHNKEAELHFKNAIALNPREMGGYAKLWNLYENQGRYAETEDVIKKMGDFNREQSDRELNGFYRRVLEKLPDDAGWNYKLGLLLYSRATKEKYGISYLDSIVWFPLLREEIFIDRDYLERMGVEEAFKIEGGSGFEDFGNLYPAFYEIPGTMDVISAANYIYLPRKDGIMYLKKAAEIIADKPMLAHINFMIGNLYQWAGSKKLAFPYLEKSLEFSADDANVRMTLIDIYASLHKNTDALKHLIYLNDSSQANVENRLLLARYYMQARQFEKADSLLNQAATIAPQKNAAIEVLRRQLIFLSKKPTEAIKWYKAYLAKNVGDSMACYTLARLYAKSGNNTEAFRYTETAIKAGFNYLYVLKNDPYLDKIKKNEKWNTMLKGIRPVLYNSTAVVN